MESSKFCSAHMLKACIIGLGVCAAHMAWGLETEDSIISKVEVLENDATPLTKAGFFSTANVLSHQVREHQSPAISGAKTSVGINENPGSIAVASDDHSDSTSEILEFTLTKAAGCNKSHIDVKVGSTKEIPNNCFPIKGVKIIENQFPEKTKNMHPCKGHEDSSIAMKQPGHYKIKIHKNDKLIEIKSRCYKIYKKG